MRLDRIAGALQWWLQGHPDKWRPWFMARIGNWISDMRFWAWYRKQPDVTFNLPDDEMTA